MKTNLEFDVDFHFQYQHCYLYQYSLFSQMILQYSIYTAVRPPLQISKTGLPYLVNPAVLYPGIRRC